MTTPAPAGSEASPAWAERAADRAPAVLQQRSRSIERARHVVAVARRLADTQGADFTIQQLASEAGIALPTFYKLFPSKDLAILAVIEDMITERCATLKQLGAELAGPLDRLRLYVTAVLRRDLASSSGPEHNIVATEHHRLLRLYPTELSRATTSFTDLLLPEIEEATARGEIAPRDPQWAAWFLTQLMISVFHHAQCVPDGPDEAELAARLWEFSLTGLGAS